MSTFSVSWSLSVFLSVSFVWLTWQDQNFITGGHQLSVSVPGKCRRRDSIGLAVQRDGIVEYHIPDIPSKAWGRCSISNSTWPVEIRRYWKEGHEREEKYLNPSLSLFLFFLDILFHNLVGNIIECIYLKDVYPQLLNKWHSLKKNLLNSFQFVV